MPGFDGTGPFGLGPMSGRRNGYCIFNVGDSGAKPTGLRGYAGAAGIPVMDTSELSNMEDQKMPRGDGTGPAGMGPLTGRGAGYCAGFAVPGFMNRGLGRGMGFGGGRGPGRGMGRGFRGGGGRWGAPYAAAPAYPGAAPYVASPPTPQQELDALKAQAANVNAALEGINKRIAELENANNNA